MSDIQWDHEASLMRVTTFATADPREELVARGRFRDLVGQALAMAPDAQDGLLLRAAGADWVQEYNADAIRELAARPGYTGAHGAFDTADRPEDPDRAYEDDLPIIDGDVSAPAQTNALGRDGEK